ncbi:MAG TPA: DUF423 domain-containing protein [Pseudomonadales bacterium]|nr:DUF423 domain-containing protein [Pseudomonadales bacterium]
MKLFMQLAAFFGALAVIIGAFGAHGLKERIAPDLMAVYQTGVQYHFYHVAALLAVGILALQAPPSSWLTAAGWSFVAGILIFSGSLYLLAISGIRWLGAITPIGGVAFIVGWIALLVHLVKSPA